MKETTYPDHARENLAQLRSELEDIDRALVETLGRRYRVAREVGRVKRAAGIPVVDSIQEAAVLRRVAGLARSAGIAEEEVRHIFWCIIDLSRGAQRKVDE